MIEKDEQSYVVDAISSIRPKSEFMVSTTYASLEWCSTDQVKPTEAEFDTALASVKEQWTAQEYARNRASAYASVGDQLDMMMKDKRDGTTTHQTACEAVKTQFPKE